MVKKILALLGKEITGLHEAAYLLAIATFVYLVLALVRDKLLAYYFGAGFLACAAAWWRGTRRWIYFLPYVAAALLFAAVTATIGCSIGRVCSLVASGGRSGGADLRPGRAGGLRRLSPAASLIPLRSQGPEMKS